jgi:hypothetical protein
MADNFTTFNLLSSRNPGSLTFLGPHGPIQPRIGISLAFISLKFYFLFIVWSYNVDIFASDGK